MSEYQQMYIEEMNGILPCSEEEERELLARMLAGEEAAKMRLIEGMLWLAFEMAKQYEREGVYLEDLVQEANMSLMQFVQEYQEGEFRTGLEAAIRKALSLYLEEEETEDKIEEEVTARANVLQEVSRVMAEDLGREPSLAELAEKMKMSEDEVKEIMKMTLNVLTVDGMG
ncbi:MAG: sigma-70 domain-containing protein [bacterium]|nr:sigma-70 domain-containing protein [bacterium]